VGNYAGQFNGSNDWINTTTTFSIGSNNTVMLWFKENAISPNLAWITFATNTGYYLGCGPSTTCVTAYNGTTWAPSNMVNDTNWHLAAFVQSGSNFTDYLDGGNPQTNTSFNMPVSGTIQIGRASFVGWWNGLIDDVRIYNRALSAAEIQAIYNATK
jgi:hypothetical protein